MIVNIVSNNFRDFFARRWIGIFFFLSHPLPAKFRLHFDTFRNRNGFHCKLNWKRKIETSVMERAWSFQMAYFINKSNGTLDDMKLNRWSTFFSLLRTISSGFGVGGLIYVCMCFVLCSSMFSSNFPHSLTFRFGKKLCYI